MKTKHKFRTAGLSLLALIPFWVFIGGIDCAPPDDADLILPESDEPYEAEGNGWATLAVSQSRLAELSGVSVHTISNLETATGNVTLATLQKVCATMGLSVSVGV